MAAIKQLTCRVCGQPRDLDGDMALCAEHRRAYYAAQNRKRPSSWRGAEYQRLCGYRAEALRQGATDDEAVWIAMACEIVYQRAEARPCWLKPFVTSELRYLRDHAGVRAKLDDWQPVGGDTAAISDDGWDYEEAV